MSLSVNVTAIKPPDEKWRKMKAVYDACIAAKVDIPQEVSTFFNEQDPEEEGVIIHLRSGSFHHESVTPLGEGQWQTRGFLVDITKLPPDVKWLKFQNSW